MSATNSTTHYELPVFIATDKPAWLVDWNGSMNAIDAGIYAAKSAADTAQAGVTANASDISTLSSTVSTQGSSLSTLSENLTTLTGTVNTITSLIGNGEPTTADKTIIGAINEINAEVSTATTAAEVTYDNTTSGMTADDVQEAIDENAAAIATINSSLTWKAIVENFETVTETAITTGFDLTNAREILMTRSDSGRIVSSTICPIAAFRTATELRAITIEGGGATTEGKAVYVSNTSIKVTGVAGRPLNVYYR